MRGVYAVVCWNKSKQYLISGVVVHFPIHLENMKEINEQWKLIKQINKLL